MLAEWYHPRLDARSNREVASTVATTMPDRMPSVNDSVVRRFNACASWSCRTGDASDQSSPEPSAFWEIRV